MSYRRMTIKTRRDALEYFDMIGCMVSRQQPNAGFFTICRNSATRRRVGSAGSVRELIQLAQRSYAESLPHWEETLVIVRNSNGEIMSQHNMLGEEHVRDLTPLHEAIDRISGIRAQFQPHKIVAEEISPEFERMLCESASTFGASDVVVSSAPPNSCHQSSTKMAASNLGKMELWSGFALKTGVWVVHSWCVKNGLVLENTPVAREAYVGVAINSKERLKAAYPSIDVESEGAIKTLPFEAPG